MADRRYSPGRTPDDELREKARMLQVLRNTNPEFSTRKQGHLSPGFHKQNSFPAKTHTPPGLGQSYRMTWSQERTRLAKERQKLQEEQDRIMQAKKRWSLPSPYAVLDPIDKRPHSNEERWESDVAAFILKTQEEMPRMIINLERMKEQLNHDKEESGNRRTLASASKFYKPWQMADYYMVRDLLLDLVDEAVERSESKPKPRPFRDKVQEQVVAAATQEVDMARKQQCRERALQLLAEELILEITREISRQTVEEYISIEQYANSLKQRLVMQSAEAVATGNPSGRAEDDPAYDLVTSTYDQMAKDRKLNRKDTWAHSQRLQLEPTESNHEQDVVVENLAPDDTIPLNLLHLPVKVGRPPVQQSPGMKQFRDQESSYWQTFSTEQSSISLAKKVQGVVTAAVSPNHRYLALGCLRGDVLVYILTTSQPLPVRCIQNESTQTDAVIHMTWSMDSSRLITINETGILQLWSMSSGGVSQKDIKDLELRSQAGIPPPSQLTQLLALDVDRSDFNFQEGPLQETGAQSSSVSPEMSVFHPSHTLLATQNTIVVGLENGDILKCNTSTSPNADQLMMETASHPGVNLETPVNYIGQDVPTELFRCHKSALIFLGFIGSHGNMVSMDTSGMICEWQYSRDSFSHFGWFQPSAKYQLELAERVYKPRLDDVPKVHFSDEALAEKRVSRQERVAAREKAEQRLNKIQMEVLWHREVNTRNNTVLQIFSPRKVQEAGSMFHGVVRQSSMDHLVKHYTYYCQPAKSDLFMNLLANYKMDISLTRGVWLMFQNFCSRVLKVHQTPSGRKLVLMLLFPAFSPKGPHISFVVLDLTEMKISNIRIDLSLTTEEHDRCLNDDVCSFGMTPVVGTTGSLYLVTCIMGTVRVFSSETCYQVMSTSLEPQGGSRAKRAFAERASVLVSLSKGNLTIITYAAKYNLVDILQLIDKNSDKSRRRVYEAYLNWRGQKPSIPYEQQHHQLAWTMDGDTDRNVELFARRLVLQLADVAVYVSEGLEIDKEGLKHFWNEDKMRAESDLLQRILARRRGESPDAPSNHSPPGSRGTRQQNATTSAP